MTGASGRKTVLIRDTEADWYAEQFSTRCPGFDYLSATDNETALRHAPAAQVVIGLAPVLVPDLFAAAPRLEWVQALTTGVDNLLAMKTLKRDVTLTNCSGFHGPQMSELAFLMMLSLNRNAQRMTRNQAARTWERWPQRLLLNKTVTILGVGAIAEELASRCNAFGMTVTGVSDGRETVPGFARMYRRQALHDAVATCDFLVVLTPYSPDTHHIVDAGVFAAMPEHAFLINISRGGCVDEAALLHALTNREIAGAGLDVFASEPLDPQDPLWSAPNVLITPHIGGMSDIYRQQAMPLVAANLNAYAAHGASALNGLITRS
ncbi:D-2-hydroxyacid dehydrogenase [Marinovum sp.]|uniref:D-2-hydroxyacid dehydrogenase n=1 Tax=Marinovum sp. TaxID=2024839 RepID=UPI002B2738E0|nr:D-2-hydroxyacid dehydrogenase [Marinovum sp.]